MKTSKLFSTISYNSIPFLIGTLNTLVKSHILDFWWFVPHKKEDDEAKDHIHLYMKPAKLIQTADLNTDFLELDLEHPDKPFGITTCQSSKFADAYLYSIHDEPYLVSKGLQRKYHYNRSDVVTSDDVFLDEQISLIDYSSYKIFDKMRRIL